MKKEKQTKTLEEHAWPQQVEHKLTKDEEEILASGDYNKVAYTTVLLRLNPREYLSIRMEYQSERNERLNIQGLQDYVHDLSGLGLNISKGDAEYGFRMPLPKNEQGSRELIIFRRWKR